MPELVGKLVLTAQQIAKQEGFSEQGYRTLFNCNADGGQEVFHIHLHLLGGRRMSWPPG
ncbi:histidine triad (HIT) protein [endosymbiont of Riftia pachyptila (vent Ph05)]|uniref:Histidine triad (HIT) protein n=1 Tax=endosymbiont of Riftia pachyptila (vent Ph05) TaxID=1048808 RepID=G2DCG8_9GAMM|nr:histidine triad (HIT) protein [endosymbiont of Riftia pachyptila (vent Ph05)]